MKDGIPDEILIFVFIGICSIMLFRIMTIYGGMFQ